MGLSENKQGQLFIDNYTIHDFLLGDDRVGQVKRRKFLHKKLPIHFIIKHKNQGKIESHKWFFKGFWEYMNPVYAQIIDWGSIAMWNSISYIVMHMEAFPQVGGAGGEIECILLEKKPDGKAISFVESVLLRAQYVEYKVSHYLDKATESLFGFISVLPGAFSTFRWKWINGSPLDAFLIGAKDEFADVEAIVPCSTANKYLAEDRIMWLEIIAKQNKEYLIHYVPGAKCLTDPPLSLTDLIKQRRRWFNGTMFASFHVLGSMWRVWKRKKTSMCRNVFFMILYFYMIVQQLISFVLVGAFYAAFSIFVRAAFDSDECLSVYKPANVLENLYLIFLVGWLMLSTTVDVNWAETGFRVCWLFMGLFTMLMVVSTIMYAAKNSIETIALVVIVIWIASYALPLMLNISRLKLTDFVKGVIYSLFLSPTYVNIFTIFAISNIHDVSWGSRPATMDASVKAAQSKKDELYKNFRANFLIFWIVWNHITGFVITYLSRNGEAEVILWLAMFLTGVLFFKLLFSIWHMFITLYHMWLTSSYIRNRASSVYDHVDIAVQQMSKSFGFRYSTLP